MKTIIEPSKELPVVAEVDIVVAGGGPGGFPAAIASARHKARTLLIERYGFLGGMATAGLIGPILGHVAADSNEAILGGLPREIVERLAEIGGAPKWEKSLLEWGIRFDVEALKYVADRMVEEAGVEILFHSLVVDAVVEDNKIKALIIENKSGRQAIAAKVFIYATGDADVAFQSCVPTTKGCEFDGRMMSMGSMFRLGGVRKLSEEERLIGSQRIKEAVSAGQLYVYNSGIGYQGSTLREDELTPNVTRFGGDGTNVHDLTKAEIKLRKDTMNIVRFYREKVPGLDSCYLISTPVQVGIRETRQIVGEYVLTAEDVLTARKFPDTVARGSWFIDIHCPMGRVYPTSHLCWARCTMDPPCEMMMKRKGAALLEKIHLPKGEWYGIPYRCLVPKEIDNLLVSGRCISATHEAIASTRVMGTCMAIGQAAGTAAALAVSMGIKPRDLDGRLVRETLQRDGALV